MTKPKNIYEKSILMIGYEQEQYNLEHTNKYINLTRKKIEKLQKDVLSNLRIIYRDVNRHGIIKRIELRQSKMNV
jgi:hypothetical protein